MLRNSASSPPHMTSSSRELEERLEHKSLPRHGCSLSPSPLHCSQLGGGAATDTRGARILCESAKWETTWEPPYLRGAAEFSYSRPFPNTSTEQPHPMGNRAFN